MHMLTVKREWTADELSELPDDGNRYEIIDGELFVSPSPALRHQEAVYRLHQILAGYLERERVGHAFSSPADIVFSPRRAVQPDVFVAPLVGGRLPDSWREVKQLLVAAVVMSPSTARSDRVAKRTMFRDEGVPEYWIVDLYARTFERSTPLEPRPEILADRLEWFPAGATEPLVIDLVAYFELVLDT